MKNNPQSQGNLWFGLLFAAVGALIMLLALDVIHSPEENFHAPRWVVLVAGLSFFGAGVFVALIDPRFEVMKEEWWFKWIVKAAQAAMPISLLVVLNWVAFGTGEREFSGGISLPFISFSTENSSAIMGRCVFGSFAVLADLVLIFIVIKAAIKWANGGKSEE
jgi:hypothetical protein